MPDGPLRVRWVADAQRFRDRDTGRWISGEAAAPWLRVWKPPEGAGFGALRDSMGYSVPLRFLGGQVTKQWPSGKGGIAAVTRGLPVDHTDMPVRPQDFLQVTVAYSVEGVAQEPGYVTMLKGRPYTSVVGEERMANALTGQLRYTTGQKVGWDEIDVESEDWAITTFYRPGDYLGADYSYFEGM